MNVFLFQKLCAPSNTPCTPPNLGCLENAFSKLNTTPTLTAISQTATSIDTDENTENVFYQQNDNHRKTSTTSIDIIQNNNKQNSNMLF